MHITPADTVKLFSRTSQYLSRSPGEVVFSEGEEGTVMYGIIEGEVELTHRGKSLEVLGRGDVFGQGALVHDNHQRQSTAIAKTDCQLATLDREHFLFAVQQTPIFALEVMKSYSDRLRHLKNSFF